MLETVREIQRQSVVVINLSSKAFRITIENPTQYLPASQVKDNCPLKNKRPEDKKVYVLSILPIKHKKEAKIS